MRSLLLTSLLLFATPALADFGSEVEPLLARHCVSCHGPKLQRSSLRLDSAAAIHAGGSNGEVVVPGKSVESLLVTQESYGSEHSDEGIDIFPPDGPMFGVGQRELGAVRGDGETQA